jgi:diguanylate cyclase (GGDEF)-like protein
MSLQEAITTLKFAVEEIARAARSDDMTPLHNALALSEVASSVGIGGDNPDVVIFGDLDNLKRLNDNFGHAAGDAAINEVGKLIQNLFVKECKAQAFRRSGDEFVVLLSSNLLEEFRTRASSFASCSFQFEGKTLETAVSFGYAVSQGESSFADLLAKAEAACQAAKFQAGGVCLEWSQKFEQHGIKNIRSRCSNCGTQITCNVPRDAVPQDGELLFCPCCGKSLTSSALST